MSARMIDWLMYGAATLAVCFCIATAFAVEREANDTLQQEKERVVATEREVLISHEVKILPVLSSCKDGVCKIAKSVRQNQPVRSAVKVSVRRKLFWRIRRR